ncbi:type VII secretion protein EccB [Amycolatopsis rhizosphaerae]|uniref:Type VII secretion protein EccB n=1 Tax=Amycolatopsis rhizosphaerae TaxID=2053003 RepID=A0A558DC94_9PSEU|nr:type VII secretion protein EccB [Amycolatopsis rhizosphaerae]TVT58654.1 type VII secretion protein EccB [Amycolatopsis rhizosphaerae]
MPTRRDQLQAYQFMMQRVTSALIVHETDPELTPLRRGLGAVFAGLMIAVLVAAGFGVYGVFTGVGGTSWQAEGSIVIERETGATYVYRGGQLQPVLNYASARLISTGQNPGPYRVAGEDLKGIPRRPPVGIAGAPDSLPGTDRIAGAPWTMCSVLGSNQAGAGMTTTTLLVGRSLPDGSPLGQRAILVRDFTDGTLYLIWNNHRFRITDPTVLRSVFGAEAAVVDAGTAWVNGLPSGPDLGPIDVPGRGGTSTVLSGFTVGDIVYHPLARGVQYYLVRTDGLAPLTELQMRILSGQYSVQLKEITASVANAAPSSQALPPVRGDAAPPAVTPELAVVPGQGHAALCAQTADARTAPVISVGGDASVLSAAIETSRETGTGTRLADRVLVPPGEVAVVRVLPSDAAGTGALNLVTDEGLRFPVPSDTVLTQLGYSVARAVPMPAALVQRIPEGPTLDPAAAMKAAPALP